MKRFLILFLLPILCARASSEPRQTPASATPEAESPGARAACSSEVLDLFASLPVQDGGRIKPLDTYAQFRLLRMNGKRSLETPAGEKLGPTAWLLDCLLYPELARTYRAFYVRDAAVLEAIGLRIEGRKKTDRYSYAELAPEREKLFAEAKRIGAIEEKQRDSTDTQLFFLAVNLSDFEVLTHGLDFARAKLPTGGSQLLRDVFGPAEVPGLEHFIARLPELQTKLDGMTDEQKQAEEAPLREIEAELKQVAALSSALALFPPEERGDLEWRFAGNALEAAFHEPGTKSAEMLAGWEALERTKTDGAAFLGALEKLHGTVVGLAESRGEYGKIPLEVSFYRGDYFTRALVSFLAAFLLVCISWLAPNSRWLVKGIWGLALLGTGLVVVGVVLRCIIRGRPPVSTLYETILFITGCITIVCLVIEWIQRQRIALALVPVLGAAGMFLAMKYELKEAALSGDTMPSLVAVLDTNFWLATHVTSVTLGYSAGLLAAVLGNLWLLGKLFGLKKGDATFYRTIARTTYGVVCFGLLFSVVGTILGGVWANYSWGRFWGWDPKENGALLICLGELFILHARMGGYVREYGLSALAALNGLAVAFSWWHVNNLGVGLHSYGKTEGVLFALYTYYGTGLLIVLASLVWRLTAGAPAAAKAVPAATT